MEIERDNDVKVMNFRSVKRVKDEVKDGDLPDWMLVEFLIRLPQKVVFRLKLVSKQWLSIISEPYFVRTYCSRALMFQKLQPWILISAFRKFLVDENKYSPDWELLVDTYSTSLKWPNICALSLPCLPHPNENEYMIYEVSNGFVLYGLYEKKENGIREYSNLRMCNPITGQWISLPSHDNCEKHVKWGFMTNVEDGVLMSYTVVCLYKVCVRRIQSYIIFQVFSSEVGEWKKYTIPIGKGNSVIITSKCAIVNGVMHWIQNEGGVIAYDPHKHPDRLCIIPLPGKPKVNPFSQMFTVSQGLLRYSEPMLVPRGFNIWVLNDYSSGDWYLQHQVKFADIQNLTTLLDQDVLRIRPAWFHPLDSCIVYLAYDRIIFSYNIKTKNFEAAEDFMQVRTKIPVLSTHFLQIPPWPVSFSRHPVSASED